MHCFQSKLPMKCGHGKNQSDGRTVRIRYYETATAHAALLKLERVKVVRIDFGNKQRNIGLHAMRRRIADDRHTGLRQLQLRFFSNLRWQPGQNEVAIES